MVDSTEDFSEPSLDLLK